MFLIIDDNRFKGLRQVAKWSEIGRLEPEPSGVRIRLEPGFPVAFIERLVRESAAGSGNVLSNGPILTGIDDVTVEDGEGGVMVHLYGSLIDVEAVRDWMNQCEMGDIESGKASPHLSGLSGELKQELPMITGIERQEAIKNRYGQIAETGKGCGCGSDAQEFDPSMVSVYLGYTGSELAEVPEEANLGLGCGNPLAIARIEPGQTVLDLGSGGGLDCFLASKRVGDKGRVIGVDMTPAMIARAEQNARRGGFFNVEFQLGEIEHLPLADQSVDVIISNCVINLSSNKRQVFREAFRVLKPGGWLAVSDVVATADIPEEWRRELSLWTNCMAGAAGIDELTAIMQGVGFNRVSIKPQAGSREFIRQWVPGASLTDYVVSAVIEGYKDTGL